MVRCVCVLIDEIIIWLVYVYYVSECGWWWGGGGVSVWVAIVRMSVYIISEYVVRMIMDIFRYIFFISYLYNTF